MKVEKTVGGGGGGGGPSAFSPTRGRNRNCFEKKRKTPSPGGGKILSLFFKKNLNNNKYEKVAASEEGSEKREGLAASERSNVLSYGCSRGSNEEGEMGEKDIHEGVELSKEGKVEIRACQKKEKINWEGGRGFEGKSTSKKRRKIAQGRRKGAPI